MKNMVFKGRMLLLLFVFACLLTACGGQGSSNETEEYLVFWSDREEFISPITNGEMLTLFGGQYYLGEPIQLWCKRIKTGEASTLEIRMYHQNGECEVILSEVPDKYFSRYGWFITETGEFLIQIENGLAKIDQECNEIWQTSMVDTVLDICQISETVAVLLLQDNTGAVKLAELDLATGQWEKNTKIALEESNMQYVSKGENGLLLLNSTGIWELNLRNGAKDSVVLFSDYNYTFDRVLSDFRLAEGNKIEFLQTEARIILSLLNVSEERTIITMRDYYENSEIVDAASKFNRENDEYFVVLEFGAEEDISIRDYREKTSIELATGKGPDIFTVDVINDFGDLLEKDMLADLSPYMEKSNVQEKDYFPVTFSSWKVDNKIYGIEREVVFTGLCIEEEVLGSREVPGIETLLDKLLAYQENVIFREGGDSLDVLNYFLRGSENLWGMVDWKNAKCDFNCELFDKMLQVALRYGEKGDKTYEAIMTSRTSRTLYAYDTEAWLESVGLVYLGYYFDDGCHTAQSVSQTMAINANSQNGEGAWEFLRYLLSEEWQKEMGWQRFSVNKKAFDSIATREIEVGSIESFINDNGKRGLTYKGYSRGEDDSELMKNHDAYKAVYDLKSETVAELKEMLEDTRVFPVKTKPILSIIEEEIDAYFGGQKSKEEVISIIENRVQLYLDEHK